MNRRLLILPVVGVAALAGSQLLTGGDSEPPPEPVFPTAVGSPTSQDWTQDGWSVNRFVDDPFQPTITAQLSPEDVASLIDPPESDPTEEGADEAALPSSSGSSGTTAPAAPPTTTVGPPPLTSAAPTTTTPPPTTTERDLSQAPPPAEDGSGVDLPDIDDLPGGDR